MSVTQFPHLQPERKRPHRPTYAEIRDLDVMTGQQAAVYVGLSESMLRQYRAQGRGPRFVRLTRQVRYRKCDLDAWLQSRLVPTRG